MTSYIPGPFSSSTKASSPSLPVRSLQSLFTQGELATESAGKGEAGECIWPKGQSLIQKCRADRFMGGLSPRGAQLADGIPECSGQRTLEMWGLPSSSFGVGAHASHRVLKVKMKKAVREGSRA